MKKTFLDKAWRKYMNKLVLFVLISLSSELTAQTLAISKAEALIDRFVTTPQEMRDKADAIKGTWDSVELIGEKELSDGRIEYTLLYSVDQGTRIYTTESVNMVDGPKRTSVARLGPYGGPNESLSAHDAQTLIDQCKEWYRSDSDYRRIVDLIESEIVTKLHYDWKDFLGIEKHTYEQALRLGVGVCDVYANRVSEVLTRAGYNVEKWSSSRIGAHAWNHVRLPNGKILYIDATWYDNCYDNHPTIENQEAYSPYYITYNQAFFEHGYGGTIDMHGGWRDASRVVNNAR
jgi:hypothetical protein